MKSIGISEELHKKLIALKLQEGSKNAAELIEKLIIEYKKQKFRESSQVFREALNKKGITFKEFLKRSKKIREEMADEGFYN